RFCISFTNRNQLKPTSIVSGSAYKNDHFQGKSHKGAHKNAFRYMPSNARGPHQYTITIPNVVGRYQSDVPGSVLNQRESQVPIFAINSGATQVHQGSDDEMTLGL